MKSLDTLFTMFVAVAAMALLTGCADSTGSTDAGSQQSAQASNTEHSHDHGEGETDHSVKGHSHGAGPHDGTIADWGGGQFHVEFTIDHDRKEAVVYILDSDEKTPVPIDAVSVLLSINEPEFQVELAPQPMGGEENSTASRFIGTHDNLGIVREFSGTMSAEVDGTPYVGEFTEDTHGHNHENGEPHNEETGKATDE